MIDIADQGALRIVTLNRPEKANALTRDMLAAVQAACDVQDHIRTLVLTGAGNVFSAGADLDAARAGLAVDPLWEQVSCHIAALPCLTIAALNGTVAGGAFGMVLACDIRLSVRAARFFYPVMRLGYLPQPSDPARLSALIGPARAKMILLAGAKIAADEALGWGLIDRIVPDGSLMEAAHSLAEGVGMASGGHLAAIKGMVR